MFILYDDHYIEYGRKGFALPNMDKVNFIHPSITLRKVAIAIITCSYGECACIYIAIYVALYL